MQKNNQILGAKIVFISTSLQNLTLHNNNEGVSF